MGRLYNARSAILAGGIALAASYGSSACSGTEFGSESGRARTDAKPNSDSPKVEQTNGDRDPNESDIDTTDTSISKVGDSGQAGPDDSIIVDAATSPVKVPQFGMLVNDLRCGLCHVTINGDVVSTSDVSALWQSSKGEVNGTWHAARQFNATQGTTATLQVTGGVQANSTSGMMPKDLDKDGFPDFPRIDFANLASKMTGSAKVGSNVITKTHEGNVVLIGTENAPIQIRGEVLVRGDLVIKGWYEGIGNIYVTGNVYIPADLRGKTSPFPYPSDVDAARAQAKAAVAAKADALAIATASSIIISDFDSHGSGNLSVFEHPSTPPEETAAVLGVTGVYSWFIGGQAGYASLFEDKGIGCNGTVHDNKRTFSRVDAFLYAEKAIGGRANRNSYAINGGVIANHFHIISSSSACPSSVHPIHGLPSNASYVNYDWRMREGLLLLKQIAPYFE